jgi:uncharacterized protein (DUF2267 family)
VEGKTGLSRPEAERAAVAVLCALEQRLFGGEVNQLSAQLPMKLRELIQRCPLHRGSAPHKFGRAEFFEIVAEDFGPSALDMEKLVRGVFRAVRALISEGEGDHVATQLPGELKELWLDTNNSH